MTAGSALAESTETILAEFVEPVMVNQGDRYSPAVPVMALQPGDRVLAMRGGSAAIAYPDGCVQRLGANEMVNVDAGERCAQSEGAAYGAAGTFNQQTAAPGGGGSSQTTLDSVAGEVTVNDSVAGSGTTLSPGDRVVAGRDGSATITFADGCVLELAAGATINVDDGTACRALAAPLGGASKVALGVGLVVGGGMLIDNSQDDRDISR